MADALIIVESPAKARTITRFLGKDFVVESSIGHIRDLPSSAAEIPAKVKSKSWARLGVDVDSGFKPLYIVPAAKKAQVKKLKEKLSKAKVLYIATDEDREGEAIAWHLVEVLKPKVPVRRMVFHEITRAAINRALKETRDIDVDLVNAQEARRVLDRLVGYEVSPLLWRKIKPKLSAGRVQSVATRLVVEREQARIRFRMAEFWGLEATLNSPNDRPFTARLTELNGQRAAVGKDFNPDTGEPKGKVHVLDEKIVSRLAEALLETDLKVTKVVAKPFTNRPYAPFMTSTLQQEAGRKLRFNARRTMRVAQSLYENGYITYMRTDSTTLSHEAVAAAHVQIKELYGGDYLPDKPRIYAKKSKSAQEAHEAIRPAGERFRTPDSLRSELDQDQQKLYGIIWKRTLASQMKDATGRRTTVRIEGVTEEDGRAVFTATGKVISFPGFLRAYVEGSDDPGAELADQEKVLPPLEEGVTLPCEKIEPTQHFTQPPTRFTEASLVKELESRGIGRPSTYATIIQTIQDRGYVWHKGPALVPTFTAFAVTRLLKQSLTHLVDYDFTARMEDELDTIAEGKIESASWLSDFYFGKDGGNGDSTEISNLGLDRLVKTHAESIDPREVSRFEIGETPEGEPIAIRVGRYGPYLQIGESDQRARVPEDLPPDELKLEKALELLAGAAEGDREIGKDPETGQSIFIKNGRFGWYVQLGENNRATKGAAKPKMASLWPSMNPETLDADLASMLLAFPREVGAHPESGEMITAQDGRYGPYIKMGKESRSLPDHESLLSVTLDEAIASFKQPKGGRRSATQVIKELGQHPDSGLDLVIKTGRFGPYVTDGTVNASVPKGKDPEAMTLDDGVQLIARREEKLRAQGKDPRAPKKKPARRAKAKKK
ncbi:MAG: type I DNA topoisomerase [Thermoanaerobaculales bacterium]|nr:type I DNA topoisomerase [Thermoanaerobaculales bacterium]